MSQEISHSLPYDHGFRTSTPQPSNPPASLVATAAPVERAIAAIWQSDWLMGFPEALRLAAMRAYARAAPLSNGRTRPANTTPNARSAAAARPRRRAPLGSRAMPVQISASVTDVMNREPRGWLSVQARTAGLGLSRISSEMTLVSRTYIAVLHSSAGRSRIGPLWGISNSTPPKGLNSSCSSVPRFRP